MRDAVVFVAPDDEVGFFAEGGVGDGVVGAVGDAVSE